RERRPYPLSGLLYCGECEHKLRAQSDRRVRRYRCRAYEMGHDCSQTSIEADLAEAQVVAALMSLQVPENWRERMTAAIAELVGDQQLDERHQENDPQHVMIAEHLQKFLADKRQNRSHTHYPIFILNRLAAAVNRTAVNAIRVAACTHSTASPEPFSITPRMISRKYRAGTI
ncbi:MAG: hypothetical protein GYA46_10675, partial [candidate division Zixibacteria bacterium]|nr:hypothetical protein [candidate division Zixibacteria bacterium]